MGDKKDVVLEACRSGEKVCLQRPEGVHDEIFHMYFTVMEELGVWFPFTSFDEEVLKCFNVAPTQLEFKNLAFIWGFEVLCEGLWFEPTGGMFLQFYGTKGVDRLSWVSISAHAGKSLFPTYASNSKNW